MSIFQPTHWLESISLVGGGLAMILFGVRLLNPAQSRHHRSTNGRLAWLGRLAPRLNPGRTRAARGILTQIAAGRESRVAGQLAWLNLNSLSLILLLGLGPSLHLGPLPAFILLGLGLVIRLAASSNDSLAGPILDTHGTGLLLLGAHLLHQGIQSLGLAAIGSEAPLIALAAGLLLGFGLCYLTAGTVAWLSLSLLAGLSGLIPAHLSLPWMMAGILGSDIRLAQLQAFSGQPARLFTAIVLVPQGLSLLLTIPLQFLSPRLLSAQQLLYTALAWLLVGLAISWWRMRRLHGTASSQVDTGAPTAMDILSADDFQACHEGDSAEANLAMIRSALGQSYALIATLVMDLLNRSQDSAAIEPQADKVTAQASSISRNSAVLHTACAACLASAQEEEQRTELRQAMQLIDIGQKIVANSQKISKRLGKLHRRSKRAHGGSQDELYELIGLILDLVGYFRDFLLGLIPRIEPSLVTAMRDSFTECLERTTKHSTQAMQSDPDTNLKAELRLIDISEHLEEIVLAFQSVADAQDRRRNQY